MEDLRHAEEGPLNVPVSELWGRPVYDTAGFLLGTVDSIAQTVGGTMRAIVQTGRWPRHFIFVELEEAVFEGQAVVVPAARVERPARASAPNATFTWPSPVRREA